MNDEKLTEAQAAVLDARDIAILDYLDKDNGEGNGYFAPDNGCPDRVSIDKMTPIYCNLFGGRWGITTTGRSALKAYKAAQDGHPDTQVFQRKPDTPEVDYGFARHMFNAGHSRAEWADETRFEAFKRAIEAWKASRR